MCCRLATTVNINVQSIPKFGLELCLGTPKKLFTVMVLTFTACNITIVKTKLLLTNLIHTPLLADCVNNTPLMSFSFTRIYRQYDLQTKNQLPPTSK